MSTNPPVEHHSAKQTVAAGTTIAAGALLLTTAVLMLLQGITALLNDDLLIIGPNYVYKLNTTTWGWIHIVIAVLMGIVAFGLVFGRSWARVTAIVMAALSIVAMFMWLPYYPLWSVIVIALDVIVIWAVATWDRSHT